MTPTDQGDRAITNAPLPAQTRQATAPAQGREAGGQVGNGDCPADKAVKELALALAREIKSGNVSAGHVRHFTDGHVELCFTLKDGSQYPKSAMRVDLAVQWMRETRTLHRAEFFAKCPIAGNSADLHNRAIKRLSVWGEITKDHGLWVWKDQT